MLQNSDIHNSLIKINLPLRFCHNAVVYILQSSEAKVTMKLINLARCPKV